MADRATGRLSPLRRNRGFALLFWATAGSAIGTYLAALALSVDIFDRTGSGAWLAALLIADFLPIVVIGITLGPLVDRLSRRRLMILSDLVRAATFAALPFVERPGLIVLLAAVNGIATGFFRPAAWAGFPNLVGEDDREQATSLLSTVEHVAWMVGPVLAGALLAIQGTDVAYWFNAATFLLSALLVARIPAASLRSDDPITKGHWEDLRAGLGLVFHSRPLLTVLVAWNVSAFATALVNVAEVPLVKDELDGGNIGLGLLVGATGLGLVVGSFFAASALQRLGMRSLYAGSLLVMAVGFGIASASPTVAVAAVLAAFATIGNGAAIVCNQLLVQEGAPDAMRGRALAVLMSTYYGVLGLAMAGGGLLVDGAGARAAWAVAGVVYLLATILALVLTQSATETRSSESAEPAGLERIRTLMTEIDETRRREQETAAPDIALAPPERETRTGS
ncbi:MAG TPA: MFS transporter [Gaiella sp.]|nr:MFS transporter [Gaiella sp.]